MKLSYVIKFVADMNRAVKFYRDVLGLRLKFESPGWSEFVTGETTLALHPASEKNPAGAVELGFTVADIQKFHQEMSTQDVQLSMPPNQCPKLGKRTPVERNNSKVPDWFWISACCIPVSVLVSVGSATRCVSVHEVGR